MSFNEASTLSRRRFLQTSGIATLSLALGGCLGKIHSTSQKPDILLILADDMGYSDLGCYGSEINTPNIDRLAAAGSRYTHFYNAARCCPSRASLLTGLYPHQAGMGKMVTNAAPPDTGPYQGFLNTRCVTLADVLKTAGYHTYMSGKWHVGAHRPNWPCDRGFDKYFGLISGAANYFDITRYEAKNVVRQMAVDNRPYTPPKENFYLTDAITDGALGFIDAAKENDNIPFFLYVAYTAPHWPLHALPEDIEKYKGHYDAGWDEIRQKRFEKMKRLGILEPEMEYPPRDEEVPAWSEVSEDNKTFVTKKMEVYAAQIDRMDQGIGKILKKLDDTGRRDNTIIIFLSDNGGCHEGGVYGFDQRKNGLPPGGVDSFMSYGRGWANVSNVPFRMFKHWTHEGGIATPFIISWPATLKEQGTITKRVGHIIDIMPTLCQVSGARYPATRDGTPILPPEGNSLLGREKPDRIYCWEHFGNKAAIQGDWKLVAKVNGDWELYHLQRDRTELNNVSAQYPDKVEELKKIYNAWARRCGVEEKKPNPERVKNKSSG